MSQELTSVGRGSQQQQRSKGPGRPSRAGYCEGGEQGRKGASPPSVHTKSEKRDKPRPSAVLEVEHLNRLHKLGIAKERSQKLVAWALENLTDDRQRRDAKSQEDCGALLWFRRFVEGPQAGDTRLRRGIFCQKLTCPLCMLRKAAKTCQAYLPKILTAWADGAPDRRLLFATHTLPNGDDLAATWNRLEQALGRQTVLMRQHRRRGAGVFANVVGGVMHIETKRGKGGQFHPHAHSLWLVDGALDFKAAQLAWSQAVGVPAVSWFRHLNTQQKLINGQAFTPEDLRASIASDLQEVLKYPMKFEGGKPADLWHIADVLRGRRRLRPFGCLHGVEVPEDMADDQPDWDTWQWVELVYGYAGKGHYQQRQKPAPSTAFDAWNAGSHPG